MTRCDFRSNRECGCHPGECDQMKPMLDLRETPVFRLTPRQHFIAAIMLIGAATSAGYAVLSMADEHYRIQQLDQQENVAWKR